MAAGRPFVGRQREREEIAGGLADAVTGRGTLFVIVGAAGIGKTRLADETVRAAEAQGFRAVWGRCWETGGAPAYWPWIQILRELVRGEEGQRSLAAIGDGPARVLAPLHAGTTDVEGAAGSDPAQARFRLFDATVALLRAAAERAPLAVVLDDLHAADPSSLALLHFLSRRWGRIWTGGEDGDVLFVRAVLNSQPRQRTIPSGPLAPSAGRGLG